MTDPRKQIVTPPMEVQEAVLEIANEHLLTATAHTAAEFNMTGASCVFVFITLLANELKDLDRATATVYLRSLATCCDPDASEETLAQATKERHEAVVKLLAAVDLDIAETKGEA